MTEPNELAQFFNNMLVAHKISVGTSPEGTWLCRCGEEFRREYLHREHVVKLMMEHLQVTEIEEHGLIYGDDDSGEIKYRGMDLPFIERRASREKHGDKVIKRTIIKIPDIVGEWEEVDAAL